MSGTQFHIPNCSNVTVDQLLHANFVRGISGAVCFLISVILLFSLVFIFRAYRNILQRLILYYAIATTVYQALNVSFLEHQFQYERQNTVCAVLGGCIYYNVGVIVMFSAFIVNYSMYLVLRASEKCGQTAFNAQRNCSKQIAEFLFVLFSLIVPLFYSWAPLTDHHYGISGPYCGIETIDGNCSPAYRDMIIFFTIGELFELEMLVAVLVTLITYCRIRKRVPLKSMDILVQKACFLSILYFILVVVNTILLVMTPLLTFKNDQASYFRHQIANAFGFPLFFEFTLIIMFAVSARISERGFMCSRQSSNKALIENNTGNYKTTPTSCPLLQPSETCYFPSYTGDFTHISIVRSHSERDSLLDGEITPQVYSERLTS